MPISPVLCVLITLCSLLQQYCWVLKGLRVGLSLYLLVRVKGWTVAEWVVLGSCGVSMGLMDVGLSAMVILMTPIPASSDILEALASTLWRFFLPAGINRLTSGQVEVRFLLLASVCGLTVYLWVLNRAVRDRVLTLRYAKEEIYGIRQELSSLRRRNSTLRTEESRRGSTDSPNLVSKLMHLLPPPASPRPRLSGRSSLHLTRRGSTNTNGDPCSFPSFDMSVSRGGEESFSAFPGNESSITSQSGSNDLSKDEIDCLIGSIMRQEYVLWAKKRHKEGAEQDSDMIGGLLQFAAKMPMGSQSEFNPEIKVNIPLKALMEENEELADVMSHSGEWDFNSLDLNRCTKEPLREVSYYLFSTHTIPEKFSIRRSALIRFLQEIECKYQVGNYYHNSLHATDVLNSVVFMLSSGLHRCGHFLDLEVFGLLVAAIGHDVSHPGVNNTFLINNSDLLALKFNDKSVLEMMHASTIFFILRRQECNILTGMKMADVVVFRKVVIALILATDLQRHFAMQAEYRFELEDQGKTLSDAEFRLRTLEICIKCADLGHGAKETSIHKQWSDLITLEFFNQGDREIELGLPLSPLCDRSSVLVPKSQIGFLSVMVKPLFSLWEELLRKTGGWEEDVASLPFEICCQHINQNIQYWEMEAKKQEETGEVYVIRVNKPPLASDKK